jgi:hypothetical protein
MASQPLTGVNQQPLVFAQITQGISAPETIKARIVTSSREVDIKSNMFLHLFYNKPYMQDQGYNYAVDQAYGFQVKSSPDERAFNNDMKAQNDTDVGDMKSEIISERELLTLSEDKTWEFKPSVRVADFFANSYGVPIDCWTPCSRIAIARELEAADLIKYELQCGAGESDACAMSAGELGRSLHSGDQLSFGDVMAGDCVQDLQGHVQLSILFVNENPEIQPLDFRLRLRILPCRCPPILVKVPKGDGTKFDAYRVKLAPVLNADGSDSGSVKYILDYNKVTKEEALCLGYYFAAGTALEDEMFNVLNYPVANSIEEVFGTDKNDDNAFDHTEEGNFLINYPANKSLAGRALLNLSELNILMNLQTGVERWTIGLEANSAMNENQRLAIAAATSWTANGETGSAITVSDDGRTITLTKDVASTGVIGENALADKALTIVHDAHQNKDGTDVGANNAGSALEIINDTKHAAATVTYAVVPN